VGSDPFSATAVRQLADERFLSEGRKGEPCLSSISLDRNIHMLDARIITLPHS